MHRFFSIKKELTLINYDLHLIIVLCFNRNISKIKKKSKLSNFFIKVENEIN